MIEQYKEMRNNVSMLGRFLGETISQAQGDEILDLIEKIRVLSRDSHTGNVQARQQLIETLGTISNDNVIPVARAFSHFLNLTNISEQYQTISREELQRSSASQKLDELFQKVSKQNISKEKVLDAVDNLLIELVLTAHPTETTRRSLTYKHVEINECLRKLDHDDLTVQEQKNIKEQLLRLIAEAWHTNEIRTQRPTPYEEAKWGYSVIENSLWEAIPKFLRELDEYSEKYLGFSLSADYTPVRFSSWMGGDRDGNPFVTSLVTQDVLSLARAKAAELFLNDIQALSNELSMNRATPEFIEKYGQANEPYRVIVKQLRSQLKLTMNYYNDLLMGRQPRAELSQIITKNSQLWEPLYDCYRSLEECGMKIIANGLLLDTLRRIKCFGCTLAQLDIRQESTRHTSAIAEITQYIGLGDYAQWDEDKKIEFLVRELSSKRPLLPLEWNPSEETAEVLRTCKIVAAQSDEVISCYVISMARTASDVLAVHLLLQECGCKHHIPVVPLFETLDDLDNAEAVMKQLYTLEWYRSAIDDKQMVMIGYSDSAKDAGMMAASWAQYRAQEAIVNLSEKHNVELTLFHGRGGTIGRGGAPAHAALLSQPPGSLKSGLRVTEQGEMIRFKLGLPQVAIESLMLYASAILEANLLPPPVPTQKWRDIMDKLSDISCKAYRDVVRGDADFVPYFRAATPEQELSNLPLGSRPAKRNPNGGVESLRAIPWIFAWMQNRLMLPAWLGAAESLQQLIDHGDKPVIEDMCDGWPLLLNSCRYA